MSSVLFAAILNTYIKYSILAAAHCHLDTPASLDGVECAFRAKSLDALDGQKPAGDCASDRRCGVVAKRPREPVDA
jgi:hypothetical protein